MSYEIVYVLSNPAMPNIVKIGRTASDNANERISQLYTTGVPVPFKLEFACRVLAGLEAERALHVAFGPYRVNPRREFFRIDPEQAIAILKLLHTEDATNVVAAQPSALDDESIAAGEQLRRRRPHLSFDEMGIPIGAVLHSVHNEATVTVIGPRKVRFGDADMSLTAATRQVLQLEYSVNPGPHWTYEGKTVRQWYDETYGSDE